MTPIYIVERTVAYDSMEPVRAYRSEEAAQAFMDLCDDYARRFPKPIRYGSPKDEVASLKQAEEDWWANRPYPEMEPGDIHFVTPTTLHDE